MAYSRASTSTEEEFVNFKEPVIYLRKNNFNSKGELAHPNYRDKIVIIFIHADYCHYCRIAKKDYQIAAEKNNRKNICFTALRIDGTVPGEKECRDILNKISLKFAGFPDYVVYVNNRQRLDFELSGRDHESILRDLYAFDEKLANLSDLVEIPPAFHEGPYSSGVSYFVRPEDHQF